MNDDKYIHNAYLNILKDNNIKSCNYYSVYLYFNDDIFIKLLSEHSESIKDRLNHLVDINFDEKYLYNFNYIMYQHSDAPIHYCVGRNKYIKKINSKISICQKCVFHSEQAPCCIINIDIDDMKKYFNIYLNQNIVLR